MAVLRHEVIVSHECVEVVAEWLNVRLPTTLAPEPMWRNDEEMATRNARIRGELAESGLLQGEQVSEEFAESIRLLCRGGVEFFAYVESTQHNYRLHAAASGRDAVFACLVSDAKQVLIRPAKHEALAEEVVTELPDWGGARGQSMSVPERDMPREMGPDQPTAQGDARRILNIYAEPRYAIGQLHAGLRDGLGGSKTSEPMTFVDIEAGRWLSYFTVDDYGDRTVVTAPGSWHTLTGKLYEAQQKLRPRRRR